MAPSTADIRTLLSRGVHQPTIATLRSVRPRPLGTSFVIGVGADTAVLFTDPDMITLRRTGRSLHLTRGDRDVLRRAGRDTWIFEQSGMPREVPVHHSGTGLRMAGAVEFLVDQRDVTLFFPLYAVDVGDITAGRIAGRTTWSVRAAAAAPSPDPEQPVNFEVDQEHGTVLAVETARERVEVSEVTYPGDLPDPVWAGPSEPATPRGASLPAAPGPTEVTGLIDQLPELPEGPDSLRIFVSEMSLEGGFPDYRVGQQLSMMLGFALHDPPIPGLQTTRRALVRNLGSPATRGSEPLWRVHLSGEGWTALAHPPIPVKDKADIEGWFSHDGFGVDPVPRTAFRITGIFVLLGPGTSPERIIQRVAATRDAYHSDQWWLRDVILDVELTGTTRTPPESQRFRPFSLSHHRNDLWLADGSLPVARCWDVITGDYRGQTLIPAAVSDDGSSILLPRHTDSTVIATAGGHAWRLDPGAHLAREIPDWRLPVRRVSAPALPGPWRSERHLGGGIHRVTARAQQNRRHGVARVGADGAVDICELDPAGDTLLSCLRLGQGFLVQTTAVEYLIDRDFHLISTRRTGPGEAVWSSQGTVAYCTEGQRLRFLDQESGAELPELAVPEDQQTRVLQADTSRITVLLHHNDHDHPEGIGPVAVARFEAGAWHTSPLAPGPEDLFA